MLRSAPHRVPTRGFRQEGSETRLYVTQRHGGSERVGEGPGGRGAHPRAGPLLIVQEQGGSCHAILL